MAIKIPKLKSRYIPVSSLFDLEDNVQWWRKEDCDFYYPNVLINLLTTDREVLDKYGVDDDTFLLVDSGGFQVIRGECDLNWETSLLKQIELNATKIFAFDKPPVKRKSDYSNDFLTLPENEVREVIRENIDVAMKQSAYLREKYPESLKRYCYVAQGTTLDTIKYNITVLEEKIGMENYSHYFPGGITISIKAPEIMTYAMVATYIRKHFIDKGIYVHFLGIGSFYRQLMMVRNNITTYDSSNALNGASKWSIMNPVISKDTLGLSSTDFIFEQNFCICPTCLKNDYNQMIKDGKQTKIGRQFVKHNLWHMIHLCTFLNSLRKNIYTETVCECFKIPENVKDALDFMDRYDEGGFDFAYSKYSKYLKPDKSKQGSLF